MKRIALALAALSLLALAAPAVAEDKTMAPPAGAATATEKSEHQAKVAPPTESKGTTVKRKRHHEKHKTVAKGAPKDASKDTGKDATKVAPAAGDAVKHQ